jgi:putative transcriptional regulator
MELKQGIFLKSTALLDDSIFADSILFITEHNKGGAVGFVVNRRYGRTLNELEEFRNCPPFPLYYGGPVGSEQLFFLHRRPDLIEGATRIAEDAWWAGDFAQAVRGISDGSLGPEDIKLFVGYCGWDAGELEAEIEEGSWEIVEGGPGDVFQ